MMKKIPCIYEYIADTRKGDRNSNFFKAINHLRQFNRENNFEEMLKVANEVNKKFKEPLSDKEVQAVTHHVCKTLYYSSCYNFQRYCKHCRYGHNRKPFKETIRNGWKILNRDNTLKTKTLNLPKGRYYLWDFLDTSKLTEKDKLTVMRLREQKGINPLIDEVIKLKGFKVGDEAKKQFMDYLWEED